MNIILIGNIVSFIGAMFMVGIGFLKSKRNILAAQCVQFGVMGLGNLILGGTTGFISNFVSIVRNLICFKWAFTTPLKIVFILIQLALSAGVNTLGWIGWLPIIAACLFTWFLDTKNEVLLKEIIILCQILWAVYDLRIQNFASLTFDVLTIVSTLVGIAAILKARRAQGE